MHKSETVYPEKIAVQNCITNFDNVEWRAKFEKIIDSFAHPTTQWVNKVLFFIQPATIGGGNTKSSIFIQEH